jgi:hypothetical protein
LLVNQRVSRTQCKLMAHADLLRSRNRNRKRGKTAGQDPRFDWQVLGELTAPPPITISPNCRTCKPRPNCMCSVPLITKRTSIVAGTRSGGIGRGILSHPRQIRPSSLRGGRLCCHRPRATLRRHLHCRRGARKIETAMSRWRSRNPSWRGTICRAVIHNSDSGVRRRMSLTATLMAMPAPPRTGSSDSEPAIPCVESGMAGEAVLI